MAEVSAPPTQPLRIAAIGDIHVSKSSQGSFQALFSHITAAADVLLLCGDFTDYGLPAEARVLARELTTAVTIPVIAVLGNHDFEGGRPDEVRQILVDAGVTMLDGEATEIHGVGFAGVKGFGGGFGRGALGPWGGFRTEIAFSHWLAKAHHGDKFIDVIYSSGNGVAEVDDEWFAHAVGEAVLGVPVRLCPAEEMIWSKAFIMERERYDGADVAHLLRHCSGLLNWDRLVARFGTHWRVLLAHVVLFGLIYPGERALVPSSLVKDLLNRVLSELDVPTRDSKVCQGTLLSRAQFLADVDDWGYEDARLAPRGSMSEQQVAEWTAAIDKGH